MGDGEEETGGYGRDCEDREGLGSRWNHEGNWGSNGVLRMD